MKTKGLIITGLIMLTVMVLSIQAFGDATITYNVGSPSYQNPDGSYNVGLTTPMSVTIADAPSNTSHVFYRIYRNPGWDGSQWDGISWGGTWVAISDPDVTLTLTSFSSLVDDLQAKYGNGYVSEYQIHVMLYDAFTGGGVIADYSQRVSLKPPVTITYNVGSPNVQNPDGSYNIGTDTVISATISPQINPNTAVSWLIGILNPGWGGLVWGAKTELWWNLEDGTVTFPTFGSIALADGTYRLKVDLSAEGTSKTIDVILDSAGPNLVITHPQDDATLNSATLNVNGNALDASGVASVIATINEVALPIDDMTGDFGGQVLHLLQPFTVTVTAIDNVGNETVKDITIRMQHDRGLHRGQQ